MDDLMETGVLDDSSIHFFQLLHSEDPPTHKYVVQSKVNEFEGRAHTVV